ncbi:ABC transporter permease subunit [Streptomyces sp. NPDC057654]|uniref:ABC transporter permease subunit n=1 Tax=Streptomyces sp. NPDC057654 TaxID=3346196 RepID=UPI0036CC6B2D
MTTPNQQQAPQEPVPPQGPHANAPQQALAPPAAQPYGQPHAQQQWQGGAYGQGQYQGQYQSQGQQGQGRLYGYASPIPVRQASLSDALASEWTKIKSVRSTMWTLGVLVALVLGIGLLVAVAVGSQGETPTPLPSFGFFGVLLGSMCVITLGALTMTSEYGTGMIRTTLTACPSRGRVLAAKGMVFFAVAFVITAVSTVLVALIQSALLSGTVTDDTTTGGDWVRATIGVSLYVATLGLLAMGVGTLLRHSAGAVTVMLGVVLLPLVLGLFMVSQSLHKVREFLFLYSIPSQLSGFYGTSMGDNGPTGWTPLWIMLGLTAVVLAGAYAAMSKRDV